mmetsp:Transcript_17802/g.67601  ORF Transcript_17802/g.67601 Transcript_17802/m.67601 type:complete len:231 (+) Transcript_17802:406-1098(+)
MLMSLACLAASPRRECCAEMRIKLVVPSSALLSSCPFARALAFDQSSPRFLSYMKSDARSASKTWWASAITVLNILFSSRCRFAISAASRSSAKRFTIPSRHPQTTPMIDPAMAADLLIGIRLCAWVMFGTGSPSFTNAASTSPPNATPLTSEQICPKAAAVIVARPKRTPMVESMASPARIITVLSMNPKPTMGTAAAKNRSRSCFLLGWSGGGGGGRPLTSWSSNGRI